MYFIADYEIRPSMCINLYCMCMHDELYIQCMYIHVSPDGNTFYEIDPDLAAIVMANFTSISEDAIFKVCKNACACGCMCM